ncbi:hypothetical protein FACS189468_3960 [Spirochaetia bacterium]|nr:hypothetical protein FACS189468_3960 [Spirochaetia bacterium]
MKKNVLFAAMAAMLGFAFVLAACGSQPSGMAAAPTGETVGGQPRRWTARKTARRGVGNRGKGKDAG